MKSNRYLIVALLTIFATLTTIPSAQAGSPQSYRWQGVAIGIGAAILGKAIYDSYHRPYAPAPQPVAVYGHAYEPALQPAGHWEARREWVPPQYGKAWTPGHYISHGRWVPGHWADVEVEAGYWVHKDVWVPHY